MTSVEFEFLQPTFLYALLALPLVWFVPRRLRHLGHGALRSLVFAALVLALAQPMLFSVDTMAWHVLVVDRSASVDAGALARLETDLSSRRDELAAAGLDDRRVSRIDVGDGESLGAALARAVASVPARAQGAITLWSDGLAVERDWARATQSITARGFEVEVRRLPQRSGDGYPTAVRVTTPLRTGLTATAEVDVIGPSQGAEVTVRLTGDAIAAASGERIQRVRCDAARRGQASFTFEPSAPGFATLRATIDDAVPGNDELAIEVPIQAPLRVLYLSGRVLGSAERVAGLLGAGFELDARTTLPSDDGGLDLAEYDVVFVDDAPAANLLAPFQTELVAAVRDAGLGLVFAGGRAAFGPGGYHGTELAAIAPVEFVQKEEKRDPSTTLVLIIDTSGSMGGERVTLAKEVSRLAMKRLLPHDKVGIVEFYGAKRWAAPIQPASNLIELQRAINRLDAGGGTVILPAIEEAFYGLQNVDTRYKHVLILTDGGVESGAFEPLLRRMSDKGINISTVLVGPEAHSEFLVSIANWGKGRFYSVPNRFSLPEIVLKQPATAELPAYREGMHPVRGRGGDGWWGEVARDAVPPLAGYVETRAKRTATVLLETIEGAAPVLATWRFGLGRVTALTTEPTGPGTAPWATWSSYGRWLGRVVARTARETRDPFDYTTERRHGRVIVEATLRVDDTARMPQARRLLEGGTDVPLDFRRVALDRHTAELSVEDPSACRFVSDQGTRFLAAAHGERASELQVDPARGLALERLAEVSRSAAALVVPSRATDLAAHPLWPWLFGLALIAYLAELLFRRLPTYAAR